MTKFKVFVGNSTYSVVPADMWTITSEGTAQFFVEGEIVLSYNRNEWFFVEVQR